MRSSPCRRRGGRNADWLFVGVFLAEMIVKIMGMGAHQYFRERWNWFDFLISVGGPIPLIFGFSISFLRSIRILRVFRLLKARYFRAGGGVLEGRGGCLQGCFPW